MKVKFFSVRVDSHLFTLVSLIRSKTLNDPTLPPTNATLLSSIRVTASFLSAEEGARLTDELLEHAQVKQKASLCIFDQGLT